MALDDYNRKRKFDQTPEPIGKTIPGEGPLQFVVQMHQASRLHFDFRIEANGVLKSWAVPKGPSLNAQDQRLAVHVEDHPVAYGSFEGIIPPGNYGAGTVMIWDEGTYVERHSKTREESEKAVLQGIEEGHITLLLEGHKLRGEFALVRLKNADPKTWLLIKKRDKYSSLLDITLQNFSVKTGRSLGEIATQAPNRGEIWLPSRRSENGLTNVKKGKISGRPHPSLPTHLIATPQEEKFPRYNKPMLAVALAKPFNQKSWIFELVRDGLRALSEVEKGIVHIYSKQHLNFNHKFPQIVEALQSIKGAMVLDGEISQSEEGHPIYWIQDLLHLEGFNFRNFPLIERKRKLQQLSIFSKCIQYVPHELQNGVSFFEKASLEGFPAILARAGQSLYLSGTSKNRLRISTQASSASVNIPRFSNVEKVYWPKDRLTKGDLIAYYKKIAPILIPHLQNRPESLHRHPHGIESPGFFQKDLVGHHPSWVKTERIYSVSAAKSIDYLLCQNEETLLYIANLGCIELNPWLSQVGSLDKPDVVVIDLDPDHNEFEEVVEVALKVHQVLDAIGANHLCKTSGATGLHFYIPVQARYDYETARRFAESVCEVVQKEFPKMTSMERSPAKRQGKIYLDCLQNIQGQTVAAVYSVRPRQKAPVSTPLLWTELNSSLRCDSFTIRNLHERIQQFGDLWQPILKVSVDLKTCLSKLILKFPV